MGTYLSRLRLKYNGVIDIWEFFPALPGLVWYCTLTGWSARSSRASNCLLLTTVIRIYILRLLPPSTEPLPSRRWPLFLHNPSPSRLYLLMRRLLDRIPDSHRLRLQRIHDRPPCQSRFPHQPDRHICFKRARLEPFLEAIRENAKADHLHPPPQLLHCLLVRQGLAIRHTGDDIARIHIRTILILKQQIHVRRFGLSTHCRANISAPARPETAPDHAHPTVRRSCAPFETHPYASPRLLSITDDLKDFAGLTTIGQNKQKRHPPLPGERRCGTINSPIPWALQGYRQWDCWPAIPLPFVAIV